MRAGIVGVGKLGSIHLRIYSQIPEIEKIYLVDIDRNKLLNYPEYSSLLQYQNLLGKVDIVSIASPTSTHFEIARFFLNKKIPVLVEKPLTDKLYAAERLIALAQKNKTLLMVGHVERYNNAYLAVKKIVKHPLFIECHRLSPFPERSLDISVVLDLMIHDLDIILDLVQDKIKKVEAKGLKVLSSNIDIANVRLNFAGGCVANLTASRISNKKERKIRVFFPNCYISLNYAEQKVEIHQKVNSQIKSQVLPIIKEEPLKKELITFVNLVKNKRFEIEEALKAKEALRLALTIQKDIEKDLKKITEILR